MLARLCVFIIPFLTLCHQSIESPCSDSNICFGNSTCVTDPSRQQGYYCKCEKYGHFSSSAPVGFAQMNIAFPWKHQYCRVNLALGKYAKQSSTNLNKPSDVLNAIDIRKTSSDINDHGCSLSTVMNDPWLMVDLGKEHTVHQVLLKRADCCPAVVQVVIGNWSTEGGISNSRCGRLTVLPKGVYTSVYCNPPRNGRYVFVRYPGKTKELSICGLEVYSDFTDFDECDANACTDNDRMLCINTVGSFTCECEQGTSFDKDQGKCMDDDECMLGVHKCNKNAYCQNTVPGYQCFCNNGYHGDGYACRDVNECKTAEVDCGNNHRVHCINTVGSYNCSCGVGFHFDPVEKTCKDVDECQDSVRLCSANTCINTYGSYRCGACTERYWKQGWECQDFDECKYGKYSCPANEACKNTIGSYQCVCKIGYKRHGKVCQDVNECKTVTCPKNNKCINTVGSFKCVCKHGYREHSKICIPVQGRHSGRSNGLLPALTSQLVSLVTAFITVVHV